MGTSEERPILLLHFWPGWSWPLINGKLTSLTNPEQVQPLTLLGLRSGQEAVFPEARSHSQDWTLLRYWVTNSIAGVQSALERRRLSTGARVKVGDSRCNCGHFPKDQRPLKCDAASLTHPRSASSSLVLCQAGPVLRIWWTILFLKQENVKIFTCVVKMHIKPQTVAYIKREKHSAQEDMTIMYHWAMDHLWPVMAFFKKCIPPSPRSP